MIYIKSDTNSIAIPRHLSSNPSVLRLNVKNNLTQQDMDVRIKDFYLYSFTYQIDIDTLDIVDGEYTYTLYDENNDVLSRGLIVFGDYKREVHSYGETNKKIQYNR